MSIAQAQTGHQCCLSSASSVPAWPPFFSVASSVRWGERAVFRKRDIQAAFHSAWQLQRIRPCVQALGSHVLRELGIVFGEAWVLYRPHLPSGFSGEGRGQAGVAAMIGSIAWLEIVGESLPRRGAGGKGAGQTPDNSGAE